MLPLQEFIATPEPQVSTPSKKLESLSDTEAEKKSFADTMGDVVRENVESNNSETSKVSTESQSPKLTEGIEQPSEVDTSKVKIEDELVLDAESKADINQLISTIAEKLKTLMGQNADSDHAVTDLDELPAIQKLTQEEINSLLTQLESVAAEINNIESTPMSSMVTSHINALKESLTDLTSTLGSPADKMLETKVNVFSQLSQLKNVLTDISQVDVKPDELATTLKSQLLSMDEKSTATLVAPDKLAFSKPNNLQLSTQNWIEQSFAQMTKTVKEQVAQQVISEAPVQSQTELSQAMLSATSTLSPLGKPQMSAAIPFNQPQWANNVAERVVWMNSMGIKEAEIQLDPPELGAMQVKVSMVNDQAHVTFVVQHASVRDALDQSAMRLREMFDAEGVELVNVDISDQSQQEADHQENNQPPGQRMADLPSHQHASDVNETVTHIRDLGLVNTYV
jgi:flagellar hook-length control protein FliK